MPITTIIVKRENGEPYRQAKVGIDIKFGGHKSGLTDTRGVAQNNTRRKEHVQSLSMANRLVLCPQEAAKHFMRNSLRNRYNGL